MTASVTACLGGEDEALFTMIGEVDHIAERRLSGLVRAACTAGVRRAIVDLTRVPAVPDGLRELLRDLNGELRTRGGWLLVDGADVVAESVELLPEVFAAYRAFCLAAASVRS